MGQAVEIGRKMKARHVILTHFSARYPKVSAGPNFRVYGCPDNVFSRRACGVNHFMLDIKRVRQEPLYRRFLKVPELPAYLEKSGNVGVAMDNLSVRFDQLDLVPKLIPIFRCV